MQTEATPHPDEQVPPDPLTGAPVPGDGDGDADADERVWPSWLAPLVTGSVASVVLLWRLGRPDRIVFDEIYYVEDALGYLDTMVEPGFAVHPTLGKWAIAGSIQLLGDTPVGWRASAALAGVATVVLTLLLARRLLADVPGGRRLALLAPTLLLLDGLFLTQSRIAMLDAFLVLLSTAALLALLVDHQRRTAPGADPPPPWRPSLRVVVGVLLGLALGVKWSALLTVGAAGLLTIAWEVTAARRDERGLRTLPRRAVAVVGSLLLVPAAVYALTWVPWLAGFEHSHTAGCVDPAEDSCTFTLGERVAGLARHHRAVASFHLNLEADHGYRSDPLTWVVLERPVVYYWESCSQEDVDAGPSIDEETGELVPACRVPLGTSAEVLSIGNPALWWGFLLLLPVLVAGTVTRDGRSALPLVGWAATWLPWLAISRTAFLFYLAPAVPLLAAGSAVALHRVGVRTPLRSTYLGALVGAVVAGAVAAGVSWAGGGDVVRTAATAGGVGWVLGAAVGGVADRVRSGAVADVTPRLRWALVALALTAGFAVYFGPLWFAAPIDADAMRDRWWFDSWI